VRSCSFGLEGSRSGAGRYPVALAALGERRRVPRSILSK
jgi:hypothetical protein